MSYLDPKVWGPHYWFFLHTIAVTYPHHPNAVTKKKYYDLIQNLHIFLPIDKIANEFSELLEQYPITPYLDNRESFVRWTWFIHNKINEKLEKPKITLEEFYKQYYENYKPKDVKYREFYKLRAKLIYLLIVLLIAGLIYYFYHF
uniref:thiol oxidase n=1 Tax=viral metagenome TaxID=1070528 RepID=A0A6C0DSL1_9ZZZZ